MKIKKEKNWGGGSGRGGHVWGGQAGCEKNRSFCENLKKWGWGRGSGGGSGWWGVRVDVNAMLGVGVMWGMGDVNQE